MNRCKYTEQTRGKADQRIVKRDKMSVQISYKNWTFGLKSSGWVGGWESWSWSIVQQLTHHNLCHMNTTAGLDTAYDDVFSAVVVTLDSGPIWNCNCVQELPVLPVCSCWS